MGRRIAWILLSFLFISGDAFPETPSVSYGNYLRYGDGREEFYDYSRHKTYIENEAELELSWKNTIAGVRYDYRNPAEFTPDRNTLKKYNIEYRRDSWNLKAGRFPTSSAAEWHSMPTKRKRSDTTAKYRGSGDISHRRQRGPRYRRTARIRADPDFTRPST